jgi:membrane-associated phospholipid phosphatase
MLLFLSGAIFSQNIDIDILRKINLSRDLKLDDAFVFITDISIIISIVIPLIMLGTGLLKRCFLTVKNAFYIGASLVTAAIVSTILKYGINRPRPFASYPVIQKCAEVVSPSFPSGHTSNAFALATSISIAYPKWYVIGPAYLLAVTVGYSRMDLGVHYPSDVIIGALIGAGSALIFHVISKRFLKYKQEHLIKS